MKKLIAAAIIALSFASFTAGAHDNRKASDYCKDHDNQPPFGTSSPTPSDVSNDNAFVDVDGHGAGVCVNQGPAKGSAGAQHTGGNGGWVFVDGDSDNPADGYVVAQASENTDKTGVILNCSGNYDHDQSHDFPLGVNPNCMP